MSSMPAARSAATVSRPIGPAPVTSTRSPGLAFDRVIPCKATASGSVSAAARCDTPSGTRGQIQMLLALSDAEKKS